MRSHPRTARCALAVLAAFLGLTVLVVLAAPKKAAGRQDEGYVGIETCAACHEETVTVFPRVHSRAKGLRDALEP